VYFINGCSLNELYNDELDFLRRPRRAALETFYAALN